VPRYRFDEFVLSPRQRLLLRNGDEQPLIPRYFDLLVFLVERRHEAVHRRDIFDRVWTDVVVSDSALTQAIRTIRRALGDDPRGPRFIRTVSRHGYRFVCSNVIEEPDDEAWPTRAPAAGQPAPEGRTAPTIDAGPEAVTAAEVASPITPFDPFEPLLERLTSIASDVSAEEDQQEAAELLHGLGTGEALRRLDGRPRHAHARALLRDTRWAVPDAGPVPILGQPAPLETARALIALRLRRASRIVAARWAAASIGGAVAGAAAGIAGGLLVATVPGSATPAEVVPVVTALGAASGAAGGAGTGAGVAAAEAVARSRRIAMLTIGGCVGGGLAGVAAQWLTRWTLSTLVGMTLDISGGLQGLAIGAAAGFGYAASTPRAQGGLAAPRGRARLQVCATVAGACGLAALLVTLAGLPLVGATIHTIAASARASQGILTPLARLIGEPDFGPATAALVGTSEGLLFGVGFALGLTRRPFRAD
jgi:DNA-binding winged helix-turn-helix (wHTH) protein